MFRLCLEIWWQQGLFIVTLQYEARAYPPPGTCPSVLDQPSPLQSGAQPTLLSQLRPLGFAPGAILTFYTPLKSPGIILYSLQVYRML